MFVFFFFFSKNVKILLKFLNVLSQAASLQQNAPSASSNSVGGKIIEDHFEDRNANQPFYVKHQRLLYLASIEKMWNVIQTKRNQAASSPERLSTIPIIILHSRENEMFYYQKKEEKTIYNTFANQDILFSDRKNLTEKLCHTKEDVECLLLLQVEKALALEHVARVAVILGGIDSVQKYSTIQLSQS